MSNQASEIKIDKDVPIPSRNSRPNQRYPFAMLEIGESFWAPRKLTTAWLHNLKDIDGKKFTCRREVREDITGTRVWRFA